MESTDVCKSCNGIGIMSAGTEWEQFCQDCITGNALALKACGSALDPAKYPACHYDIDSPGCNDQGKFPDGSDCDCERVSILGFESMGCSHETAIKVMCALASCDYGCDDPVRSLVDKIDEIQNTEPHSETAIGTALNQLVQENQAGFQVAVDHQWLKAYL